ncbi:MAG: DUF4405 domain-containing protein [Candidatus Aenigmatarchaeota archaeon]
MEIGKIIFIVDALLIISLIFVAISGAILFFRDAGIIENLYGIKMHEIKYIHNYFGIYFIILSIIHLALHVKWILYMSKKLLQIR